MTERSLPLQESRSVSVNAKEDMNTKAAHQALLQAARDGATISYGEIVGLARLTGSASTKFLVPDVSQWQTWLSPPPADPSVAHKDMR